MFQMRRLMVDSDIGIPASFSLSWMAIMPMSLTLRSNTARSSSVKLHSHRNRSHSGSVNSVLMFKGSPLFLDLSPLGLPLAFLADSRYYSGH